MICRGAIKLGSDHVLSAGNNCRPDVVLILLHRLRSQALCRLPRPVYGDASRAWCTTFVFLQWCASEAASRPRHKTLNEDINFGQHVTAPLKKHFVVARARPPLVDLDLSQVHR